MKKLNIKSTSSFFSHKSPWGSYSSFILGKLGEGGGFSLNSVHPQKDNIYIGYKQGKDKPRMMPFFSNKNVGIGKEIYFGINVARSKLWYLENTTIFSEKEISRNIRWATETWLAGNLTLRFITPFGKVPYPLEGNSSDIKFWIAPLIFVQIELDNSKYSEEMTGIFALQGMRRPLSDTSNGLLQGAANGNKYGFAVKSQDGVQEILDWDIVKTAFSGGGQIRRLAFEGGLMFLVPKGEKKSFTLALATFQEGFITSNIKAQFYYTCFFKELEDVLNFGLSHFNEYLKVAQARDKELEESGLNQYRQFIIAHATRSYLANTELLIDQKGNPIFIVNEGEYQMMNTLDLTVDQAFWEIYFTPWTLKNVLDFYKDNYSYTDYVKVENTDKASGGIGFCHDQGVANMFSPKGYSSYELSGLSGCFSYMTSEETVNYILTAGIYGLLERYFLVKKE